MVVGWGVKPAVGGTLSAGRSDAHGVFGPKEVSTHKLRYAVADGYDPEFGVRGGGEAKVGVADKRRCLCVKFWAIFEGDVEGACLH